jgi:hypothetical protein
MNGYGAAISGVGIVVEKQVGGSWIIISQDYTDDSGLVQFWLDPDYDYRFTASKSGYTTVSQTFRPTTDIRTITMGEPAPTVVVLDSHIMYAFSPDGALNNNTKYNFTFRLNSSYFDITSCTLYIKNGSTIYKSSSSSFTARWCDITIEADTGKNKTLTSEAVYIINGTAITKRQFYSVNEVYTGQFSLKNFLDDMTAFGQAGFNDFSRMIIALIVIFAIVAASAQEYNVKNADFIIAVVWLLVIFFSYIGWFRISSVTFPPVRNMSLGWLNQYIISVIISLFTAGYFVNQHNKGG